jgi:hypothetical protein
LCGTQASDRERRNALVQAPKAFGDRVEAAKGLRDFAKANPALVIKGGYVDGASMDAKEIAKLADLESREVLLGKLAGAMLASLSQAVYLLNAPLAQAARLAGALQAKAEQDPSILKGGTGEPVAETPEVTEDTAADEAPAAAEAESTEVPAVSGAEDTATDEAPAAAEAESTEAPAVSGAEDAAPADAPASEEPEAGDGATEATDSSDSTEAGDGATEAADSSDSTEAAESTEA